MKTKHLKVSPHAKPAVSRNLSEELDPKETLDSEGPSHQQSHSAILSMQRSVGNQAVMRMLANRSGQAPSGTVQRNGATTFFRRTFGTNAQQKAENPVTMDETQGPGADFLKQAQENQSVFDREDSEDEAAKARKIEVRNKQRLIKLEMGKKQPDQQIIKDASDDIAGYKKDKEGQLDTSDADDAAKYSGLAGSVTGFAGSVAGASRPIAKLVNPGDTATIGKTTGSGNDTKILEVGNAVKASNVIGGITDLATIAHDVSGIVSNIKTLTSGKKSNAAQRMLAGDQLVDGVLNLGQTLVTTAQRGESLAGAFGGSAMANEMATQVPILGIVTSMIGLAQTAANLIAESYRVHKERQLVNAAEKNKDAVYIASLSHLRNRDIQLVASSSVELVVLGLKVAGNIATLTGIGATVGVPLNAAAAALGGANKVAHMLADSYKAGLVLENRKQFKESGGTGASGAGAASVLIAEDVKHATQTLVSKARKFAQDPVRHALDEMAYDAVKLYGINLEMLKDASIPDKDLRALIIHKLQESEDPETLGQKLKNVVDKIKSIPAKAKELGGKPTVVRLMSAMKNLLNYGGKGDRGKAWRFGQFMGGESAPEMEAGIKYLWSVLSIEEKFNLMHDLRSQLGEESNEWKLFVTLNKKS